MDGHVVDLDLGHRTAEQFLTIAYDLPDELSLALVRSQLLADDRGQLDGRLTALQARERNRQVRGELRRVVLGELQTELLRLLGRPSVSTLK